MYCATVRDHPIKNRICEETMKTIFSRTLAPQTCILVVNKYSPRERGPAMFDVMENPTSIENVIDYIDELTYYYPEDEDDYIWPEDIED